MKFKISQEVADKIAARLPAGRTLADVRIVPVLATLVCEEELNPTERAIVASEVEKAGGPPMISNGKPTIIRTVAWLAHEGKNLNNLRFEADDLGAAADAIRVPDVLPMDWNHSAVIPWSYDAKAIGVWYSAEKRWDPKAADGKGAYGILAQGVMWAWAFPQYADTMLAEQERHGHVRFSMAAVARSYTLHEDGSETAHKPVFFTLSALDVPNADPDANGFVVEGSDDAEWESKQINHMVGAPVAAARAASQQTPVEQADATEEQMDELQKQINDLRAALDAQNDASEQLTAAQAQVVALTAEIETLKGQVTEVETAREALEAEATATKTTAEELKTQLDAATARLAEIDAAAEAAANAARYAARLAELPESYRTALSKRNEEDRARFEAKWTAAQDEQWSEFKSDLMVGFANIEVSYLAASQKEGSLPTAESEPTDEIAGLVSSIKK